MYNDSSGWMSLNFSRELLCIGENGLLYDKNLDIIKYRLNHLVRLSLSMIPKLKYETLERFQRDSPEYFSDICPSVSDYMLLTMVQG